MCEVGGWSNFCLVLIRPCPSVLERSPVHMSEGGEVCLRIRSVCRPPTISAQRMLLRQQLVRALAGLGEKPSPSKPSSPEGLCPRAEDLARSADGIEVSHGET